MMNRPARILGIGVLFGLLGAAAQVWLLRFGLIASAPIRGMVSICIAIAIGVVAGTLAKENAVKTAALMGVVAGAILTIVGLSAVLLNPQTLGENPFASAETLFTFVSSLMAGTAVASWLISAVAMLVTWPLSLTQSAEEEG